MSLAGIHSTVTPQNSDLTALETRTVIKSTSNLKLEGVGCLRILHLAGVGVAPSENWSTLLGAANLPKANTSVSCVVTNTATPCIFMLTTDGNALVMNYQGIALTYNATVSATLCWLV